MSERTVAVGSAQGLHARPASIFTEAAKKSPVKVTVGRPGGAPVDAVSMLLVMTLMVKQGEEVVLRAEGVGAEEALDELAELLARDLDAAS